MFTSFSSTYKIITNLATIRDTISTIYTVVVKTSKAVTYLETQINDTKLGVTVAQYLPLIKNVLAKIQSLIEKYGALIGITPITVDTLDVKNPDDHKKSLQEALDALDKLLKK